MAGKKYSEFTNKPQLDNTDLLLTATPGVSNQNTEYQQFLTQVKEALLDDVLTPYYKFVDVIVPYDSATGTPVLENYLLWCNGTRYSADDTSNPFLLTFYNYLVANSSIAVAFGLDTTGRTFAVPNLKDRVLRNAGSFITPYAGQEDAIQNITGNVSAGSGGGFLTSNSGAAGAMGNVLEKSGASVEGGSTGNVSAHSINFDASRVVRTASETRVKAYGVFTCIDISGNTAATITTNIVTTFNGRTGPIIATISDITNLQPSLDNKETKRDYGVARYTFTGSTTVNNGTSLNLGAAAVLDTANSNLTNITLSTTAAPIPDVAPGTFKTPAPKNTLYQDYSISVRITGTIGGGAGTPREFIVDLQRPDNTLIDRRNIVKIDDNNINNRGITFETYVKGATDPFITNGFKLIFTNNSSQSVTITGYTIMIKAK